jgi:hypothetical protein
MQRGQQRSPACRRPPCRPSPADRGAACVHQHGAVQDEWRADARGAEAVQELAARGGISKI